MAFQSKDSFFFCAVKSDLAHLDLELTDDALGSTFDCELLEGYAIVSAIIVKNHGTHLMVTSTEKGKAKSCAELITLHAISVEDIFVKIPVLILRTSQNLERLGSKL